MATMTSFQRSNFDKQKCNSDDRKGTDELNYVLLNGNLTVKTTSEVSQTGR